MSEPLTMTRAQQEIRLASALRNDGGRDYRFAQYCEIRGPLVTDLFRRALRESVAATDAIRVNAVRSRPLQTVRPAEDELSFVDLTDEPDPAAAAWTLIDTDLQRSVDLVRDPLYSFLLLRLGPKRYWWYQAYHHFAVDGFGVHIFERRVAYAYGELLAGREFPGNHRFVSIDQAVAEDAAYASSPRCADDRSYWVGRLTGWRDDAAGPLYALSSEVVRFSDRTSAAFATTVANAASARGVKKFELLVAGCAVYLRNRRGWGEDVVIGLPVLARDAVDAAVCPVTSANLLPLRVALTGDGTAHELLRSVRTALRELGSHARYRGEDLARDLGFDVAITDSTRFVVNYMPFTGIPFTFGDAPASTRNVTLGYTRDLALSIHGNLGSVDVDVDFDGNAALYSPDELAAQGREIIRWVLAFPGFLDSDVPIRALQV